MQEYKFKAYEWYERDVEKASGEKRREITICCHSKDDDVSCHVRVCDYPIRILCELPSFFTLTKNTLSNLTTLVENLEARERYTRLRLKDCIYGNITVINTEPFDGYLEGKKNYLVLYFKAQSYIDIFKPRLETPTNFYINGDYIAINVCESEKEFDSSRKFTIEKGIRFSGWFKCRASEVPPEEKKGRCRREYIADINSFSSIPQDESISWVSNPMLCAFDLESQSANGVSFPDPLNPICRITTLSMCLKKGSAVEKIQLVTTNFVPNEGDTVIYLKNERLLLEKFFSLINEYEVDIFSGHNILGYDWRYIYLRMRYLHMPFTDKVSRIIGESIHYSDESWGSNNASKVDVKYINIPGRINLDTYHITRSIISKRLPNYKLDTVAKEYLKEGKNDISPKEMFKAFDDYEKVTKRLSKVIKEVKNGIPIPHSNITQELWKNLLEEYLEVCERTKKVSSYCLQDSALILKLFDVLNILPVATEYSNVIEIRMKYVYTKGQLYKGLSQIYSILREYNVVFNASTRLSKVENYEGALNLGTMLGKKLLEEMVVSLDINGMYPSIIEALNICTSTEVSDDMIKSRGWVEGKDYTRDVWEDYKGTKDEVHYNVAIVSKDIHVGFIPRLVTRIKQLRNKAKEDLKSLTYGTPEYVVKNGSQEAYKVVNNSIYGIMGSRNNKMFKSKHLAALVTYRGRCLLLKIKAMIENGGEPNKPQQFARGTVIYGDTDSIQFVYNEDDLIRMRGKIFKDYTELLDYAYIHMQAICNYISPIKLVIEKMGKMLLMGPKKYVFYLVDHEKYSDVNRTILNPKYGRWTKLCYIGVEYVKRNQTPLLKRLYKRVTELIMSETYRLDLSSEEREVCRLQEIIDTIACTVYNVYNSKYTIDDFCIYEAYNKESTTTAMSKLVNRMALKGKPILLGERVPYVIVNSPLLKKSCAMGLRMRIPDDIGSLETIYEDYYVQKISTALDPVLYSTYSAGSLFHTLLSSKNFTPLISKLGLKIDDNSLMVPQYYEMIRLNVNREYRKYLKPTYDELVRYRSSQGYTTEVPSKAKTNITSSINKVNKVGYSLITTFTNIVENMTIAYKLGVLYEYKNAICVNEVYV
jgi:DNA polymerase elongation subunit (family B)